MTSAAPLDGMPVWLSISDSPDLMDRGFSEQHVRGAVIEFARYVLTGGGDLVYGGDLRVGGYTRALFELVDLYATPWAGERRTRIVNFLAWPRWEALTEVEEKDLEPYVRFEKVPRPVEPARDERHQNALALTALRHDAHRYVYERNGAHVALGGRVGGFSGHLPGLLEEVALAVHYRTPVFIIGAFGGAAQEIGRALFRESNAERFESFSGFHPTSYELMDDLRRRGPEAFRNGLTFEQNRTLVETTDVRLALRLTLEGLVRIAREGRGRRE